MKTLKNHSLKSFHTFGINVIADEIVVLENEQELINYIRDTDLNEKPWLILGEGSNVLFSDDFAGRIIQIATKGREVVSEDEEYVFLKVAAGENWDDLVEYCVEKGWGGLENLSLIPGNVGTSPIQNIGAYGVEIKDNFIVLEALEIKTGEVKRFDREECKFGYRNSIFKSELKGEYIILTVTFRLDKHPRPVLKYKALSEHLSEETNVTIEEVRDAVIDIRRSKLPDPEEVGNAGSFFKNPVVSNSKYQKLSFKFDDIPSFPADDDNVKVPAAWLIEQCGWKGYRHRDAGVYEKQALVLVNYGHAGGKEIVDLAWEIRNSVIEKFGIELEAEVNII